MNCRRAFWARGLVLVPLLVASLTTKLAGCGSQTTSTPAATPLPPLTLPAELAGRHVFVSDIATGDLAELGAKTYHVSRSVHGLGISTDHRWLYVTDVAGNRLYVYPLANGALGDVKSAHVVPVGAQPVHVVNSLDGRRLFVTNFAGASVSVIDTSTWTVTKTITTPASPHGIVLSPDGHSAYVACYGAASIVAIDTASLQVAQTIALPALSEPYGIATSSDGRYLYASDNLTGRLFVVDTSNGGGHVLPSVLVGQRPALIAHSSDGKTLYVTSGGSHSLAVVSLTPDPAHPSVRATVNLSGYPHGLAVTPDGRYVVVATTSGKTLMVVDTQTDTVVATAPGESYPNDVLIAG
jgi:YVTN family beta-propeller protein